MTNTNTKTLNEYLIAGFGGQGVLFTGKLLATIGLISDKNVTWMPSYGPAMRGGTCNCAVCISDDMIGSPVVHNPDTFICMNGPSFEKFIGGVKKGGVAYIDSSIITDKYEGDDITCHYIPASKLALENGMKGMSNIIILGKLIKESNLSTPDIIEKALRETISARKANLIDLNLKALEIGGSL